MSKTPRIPPLRIRENHLFIPVKLYGWVTFLTDRYAGIHDWDSGTGTQTVETERLNAVFRSPLYGKFRLKSYYIGRAASRYYVDTVTTTYHYRMYARPVQITEGGTVTDLDVESTIMAYDRGAAATAGWVNDFWAGGAERHGLDIPINGWLGLRLRTTSWADAPATTGHGLRLGDPLNWWIMFEVEREL